MNTLSNAVDLFGEQFADCEVHTFTVADGQGFYVTHTVDNTRTVATHYEILIRWTDGSEERSTAESAQELKLWTDHL